MSHQYIQLPPDSTGKKTLQRVMLEIDFDNGTIDFELGDRVVCSVSGVTGDVTRVEGTTNTGAIHLILTPVSSVTLTDGENIQVDGITYATVNGTGTAWYIPNTVISGGNSPENIAFVDQYGALSVAAPEGHLQLDAFGRLQVSQIETLGSYLYRYDKLPNDISEETTGTASSTFNPDVPCVEMSIGDSTADYIVRTTDVYHMYQPGISQLIEMTLWHGDAGKEGSVRRWGYFDDNNGLFFELNGTTIYTVVRSSASGSMVETKVAQANWNMDNLNGDGDINNLSKFNLDLTKSNIFFIDFQWLGVGRIRFGVNINGTRIVCHEHNHANNYPRTTFGAPRLPLRWEMLNSSNTSGTSEMNSICSTVKSEGKFQPEETVRGLNVTNKTVDTDWTYITSIRASELDFAGKPNRIWIVPSTLKIYSSAVIEYRVTVSFDNLSGYVWQSRLAEGSLTEYDVDSTSVGPGIIVISGFVSAGESKTIDTATPGDVSAQSVKAVRRADITAEPLRFTLEARAFTGTSTVHMAVDWFEI